MIYATRNFTRTAVMMLAVSLVFYGCSKDNNSQSGVGTITGTVSPSGSAVNVVAALSNGTGYIVLPDANGRFSFTVIPGNYSVSANPAVGYAYGTPVTIPVSVISGKEFPVGNFALMLDSTYEIATYSLDTSNYTIYSENVNCAYLNQNLAFSLQTGPTNGDHTVVTVIVNGVSGPGNYSVAAVNALIRITEYVGSSVYTWSTTQGGSGSIVITSINTVVHRVTGTFTVSAVPENGSTTGTKVINNGVFNNLFFP
ncbi:MAG TPA: DUF6252 family protein [Chitinophagaceae bacterium]|jgi:hypothetical protein